MLPPEEPPDVLAAPVLPPVPEAPELEPEEVEPPEELPVEEPLPDDVARPVLPPVDEAALVEPPDEEPAPVEAVLLPPELPVPAWPVEPVEPPVSRPELPVVPPPLEAAPVLPAELPPAPVAEPDVEPVFAVLPPHAVRAQAAAAMMDARFEAEIGIGVYLPEFGPARYSTHGREDTPSLDRRTAPRRRAMNDAMRRVLACAVLLLAACSGGPSSADGGADAGATGFLPPSALAPLQACAELAQSLGDLEVRCGRMAAGDEPAWTRAFCAGAFATQQGLFDAGLLAYDATAVACEKSFREEQPCNLPANAPSGCTQLAWGVQVRGAACGDPAACQNGDYCDRLVAGAACGSCTTDPGLGGACGPAASGAPCAGGACDGFNCQEAVGRGQPCGVQSTVCGPLLSCNTVGLCEDPAGVGAGCGSDGDCQDGLFCDPNQLVCLVRVGDGGPCPTGGCLFGFACVAGSGDGGRVCAPMFPGGSCTGGFCLEGEGCADGGCVAAPGPGQPCAAGASCLAGACVARECQELAAGQPCRSGLECATGLCGGSGAQALCAGACSP